MNRLLSLLGECRDSIIQGIIALSVGFVVFTLMERAFLFSGCRKPWRATLLDL